MVERRRLRSREARSQTPQQAQVQPQAQSQNQTNASLSTPPASQNPEKPAAGSRDAQSWRLYITWLGTQNNVPALAAAYEEIVTVWPESAEAWMGYLSLPQEQTSRDALFKRGLPQVADASVWRLYIDYALSRSPEPDETTQMQTWEYALARSQYDFGVGILWKDYIDWLGSRAATTSWDLQHRTDLLRKAYRQAVAAPSAQVETIWRQYDSFEAQVARSTHRKFVDERSGAYMLARAAWREFQQMSPPVVTPDTMPTATASPSVLADWYRYLEWETANPLQLSEDDVHDRVRWVLRRARAALRWTPSLWFAAASLDPTNALDTLWTGLEANSRSLLLALRIGDEKPQQPDRGILDALELVIANSSGSDNRTAAEAFSELVRLKAKGSINSAREVAARAVEVVGNVPEVVVALAAAEHDAGHPDVSRLVWRAGYRQYASVSWFVAAYLSYLIKVDVFTDAQAVFERAAAGPGEINGLPAGELRPIFDLYLDAVAGRDPTAANVLTARYRELYGSDELALFARRFRFQGVDPIGRELADSGTHLAAREVTDSNNLSSLPSTAVASSGVSVPPTELIPESVASLLESLPPASAYDGPAIAIPRLLELLQTSV